MQGKLGQRSGVEQGLGSVLPHQTGATSLSAVTARSLLRHRLLTAGAAACLAVAVLTGCAAGQRAPTSSEISVVDGVNADIGSIALRNIGLAAPTAATYKVGDDAQLVLAIANNGQTADQLTSVTSKVAATSSSTLPGQGVETPGSSASTGTGGSSSSSTETSGSTESSSSSTGTAGSTGGSSSSTTETSGSSSTSATAGTESSSGPLPFRPVTIPPGELVAFGYGDTNFATITLHGLTEALTSGQTLAVTFTFAHAGSLTVTIGVRLANGDTGGPTIDISPPAE